jgi:hypothetical protein
LATTAVGFLTVSYDFSYSVPSRLFITETSFGTFAGNSISQIIFYHVPIGILLLLDVYFFLSLMFNSNLMYCWQKQEVLTIRSNRKISTASKEQEE